MVLDKKMYKDFQYFIRFVAMATIVRRTIILIVNSEGDSGRIISVKFHQIGWVVSDKMFRIKVNVCTHTRTLIMISKMTKQLKLVCI